MIISQLALTLCILATLLFLESLENNKLLLAPLLKYKALIDDTVEILWLRYLLLDLQFPPIFVIFFYNEQDISN
jgi:hypothetical protein